MKTRSLAIATTAAMMLLSGLTAQGSRDRSTGQFNDHDQQVAKDYYSQHKSNPPVGLRDQDKLSAAQESGMHEGGTIDRETRRQVHPAPPELVHQLPRAPMHQRYVAVGGHIGLIDNNYKVKAVIHLHDN